MKIGNEANEKRIVSLPIDRLAGCTATVACPKSQCYDRVTRAQFWSDQEAVKRARYCLQEYCRAGSLGASVVKV
jgi:hypothetical protein